MRRMPINLPFVLIGGTIVGAAIALAGQRRPSPQYGPFAPLGRSFQYDWPYPLWGGTGTVTYTQTTSATPGSWSLIIVNPAGLVQHSDFSKEEWARGAFAGLSPKLSLTDQQGRFVRWGELSVFLYDPNGHLIATKTPESFAQ